MRTVVLADHGLDEEKASEKLSAHIPARSGFLQAKILASGDG